MVIPAIKQDPRRRSTSNPPEKIPILPDKIPISPEKIPISPESRRSIQKSRLHNFSFPPTLSWGTQKLLRCVNPTNRSIDLDPSPSLPPPISYPKLDLEDYDAKDSNPLRRLNLRSRRLARNSLNRNRNPSPASLQSRSSSCSPMEEIVLTRFDSEEKGERRKFSISLSKEEIEADFVAAKGAKPPRRPKKRAKYLQRQIDFLFPGILLSEVTSDLYKIEEIES